jgi:thiol-disulfide isomerase/thioredoxin
MKKIILSLILIAIMAFGLMADENADYEKGFKLFKEGKYSEALKMVNQSIKKYGETQKWLTGKFHLLMEMQKFDKALEVALKRDKLATKKSPWVCFDIAGLYVKMKKYDDAMTWLETAAERGFKDYTDIQTNDHFTPLKDHKRMAALIAKLKQNLGIGKPPKDFTVKTLDGKDFTLSKTKGKVLLIDFWATWCGPCVKEIPALKKYYDQFKPKGFEIIGVSLDKKKDKLTGYIKKETLKWPVSFSGKGWGDDTAKLYGVRSIPSTWLLDKKGNLRHFGLRGEALAKAIQTLLSE